MKGLKKDPTKFLTHQVKHFPEYLTLPGEKEEYMLAQLARKLNVPQQSLRVFTASFNGASASITIYNPLSEKALL